MKQSILIFSVLLLLCAGLYVLKGFWSSKKHSVNLPSAIASNRLQSAVSYAKNEGLDTEYAFFINMKKESGSRRF